jgi:hypothetical protein
VCGLTGHHTNLESLLGLHQARLARSGLTDDKYLHRGKVES